MSTTTRKPRPRPADEKAASEPLEAIPEDAFRYALKKAADDQLFVYLDHVTKEIEARITSKTPVEALIIAARADTRSNQSRMRFFRLKNNLEKRV